MEGRPPVAARKMGNHRGLPLQFKKHFYEELFLYRLWLCHAVIA
jgi:hypothetical protein